MEAGAAEPGYAYTAREWDPEINLYYYRARYYDPKIGRFISEDPIGLRGGVNLYAYVHNRPVRFIDPMGLCPNICQTTWVPDCTQSGGQCQIRVIIIVEGCPPPVGSGRASGGWTTPGRCPPSQCELITTREPPPDIPPPEPPRVDADPAQGQGPDPEGPEPEYTDDTVPDMAGPILPDAVRPEPIDE
jgi:RHS repeat-associated protein